MGCGNSEKKNSTVKVANGERVTDGSFAATGHLFNAGGGRCTLNFISNNSALTAAHCVEKATNATVELYGYGPDSSNVIEFAREIVIHKGYRECKKRGELVCGVSDIAMVLFPENTFTGKAYTIATSEPAPGATGVFVGFGRTEKSDPNSGGNKNKGTCILDFQSNTPINCLGVLERNSGLKDKSAALKGDSGGAILVDGKLVGTAVGNHPINATPESQINIFTNLNSQSIKAFLADPSSHERYVATSSDETEEPDSSGGTIGSDGDRETSTGSVLCTVDSSDGPMNVRLTPDGKILGKVTHGVKFLKVGVEGNWVKAQIRLDGVLFGAGGTGSPTAYIHSDGVKCP
jgi:hypothetical protein